MTLLADEFTFITSSEDEESHDHVRSFLEMIRLEMVDYTNLFKAHITSNTRNGSEERVEFGLLSGQDPRFISRLINVTKSIESRTGVNVEIENIEGGVQLVDPDQESTWYVEDDFDRSAGKVQCAEQRPLAEQHLIQLEISDDSQNPITIDILKQAVLAAVAGQIDGKGSIFSEVPGFVMSYVSSQGTLVVVSDGSTFIDVNVFAYQPELVETVASNFEFSLASKNVSTELVSHDRMPRGIGRVVNLLEDFDDVKT